MNDHARYEDMIPAYLAGELRPEDRESFEKAIEEDAGLVAKLRDARFIEAGLGVMDAIGGEHPEAELLVTYAENPSGIESPALEMVKSHLNSCSECRLEVETAREAFRYGSDPETGNIGMFGRFARWLFTPRANFRPVYVAVTAVLVLAAAYVGYQLPGELQPQAARYELSASVERGAAGENLVIIPLQSQVATFQFLLPTIEGRTYTIDLLSSDNAPVMSVPGQKHAMPMQFEVPTAYLSSGTYRVRVTEEPGESSPAAVPDTFTIDFQLEFEK